MIGKEKVELIKQLLSLSKSKVNAHEAQVAALKAQQIMAKYNISLTDVETEEQSETIEAATPIETGAGRKWKYTLAAIVASNFKCKVFGIKENNTICFYGYSSDTQVAAEVFKFLFKHGDKMAAKEVREIKKKGRDSHGVYNTYLCGFCHGLQSALDAQCKALQLVVPKEVIESYDNFRQSGIWQQNKRSGIKYQPNTDSYNNGYREGRTAMQRRELDVVNI